MITINRSASYKLLFIVLSATLVSFFATNASAQTTLVFPKDSIVTNNINITFIWNEVQNASTYTFEIDNDPSFPSPISSSGLTATSTSPTLSMNESYYWRVQAIVSGSATAWSQVHFLRTFHPATIASLTLWLSADSNLVIGGANEVSTWTDLVNSTTLNQFDPARQPQWEDSIPLLNNQPVVRYDAAGGANSDYLFTPHTSTLDLGVASSMIGVLDIEPASFMNIFTKRESAATNSGIEFQMFSSKWVFSHIQSGSPFSLLNIETPFVPGTQVFSVTRGGANGGIFRNGIDLMPFLNIPSGNPANASVNNSVAEFRLGANRQLTSFFKGGYAEFMLFTEELDTTTRQLLEAYLFYKYAPPVNLGSDTTLPYSFCSPVILDASERYTNYQWSTGATTQSISVTSAGLFAVTVTDVFGKVSTDTVLVNRPIPSSLTTSSFCSGDNIVWNTDLGSSYTYQWSDGSTADSLLIDTPNNYSVLVTDSLGCTFASDTLAVSVDTFANTVSVGPDTISFCDGNVLQLASGAENVSIYQWSTGSIDTFTVVTQQGDYSVTVTNANGCTAVDSIFIFFSGTAPLVDFSATTVCQGAPTSFTDLSQVQVSTTDTIVSWLWRFPNGDSSALQNPTYIFPTGGNNLVELTVTTNTTCGFTLNKVVPVLPNPVSFFTDSLSCEGNFYQFQENSTPAIGDPITTYNWDFQNSITSSSPDPVTQFNNAGIYNVQLVVTSQLGCVDTFTRPFTVVPQAPLVAPPSLINPINNIYISTDSIKFVWNDAPTAVSYILEIATDSSFNNIFFSQFDIDSNVVCIPNNFNDPRLFWRIQSINVCGSGSITAPESFRTFDATNIGNLNLWLMGNKEAVTVNGAVSSWGDQSTNNNDGVQNNSSQRPQLVNDRLLNGLPTLRFNGGDDEIQVPHTSSLFFDIQMTTIMVVRTDTNAGASTQTLLSKRNSNVIDPGIPQGLEYFFINSLFRTVHGDLRYEGNRFQGRNILSLTRNDEIVNLQIDKAPFNHPPFGSPATGQFMNNNDPIRIGNGRNVNAALVGDIAEVLMFSRELSDSEIKTIEEYLNDKYAPPVNLGPDITVEYGFCDPVILDAERRFLSYTWSTGDTSHSIAVRASGIYSVTTTDVLGRITADSIIITLPSFDVPEENGYCLGDSLLWNINLPKNGYTYQWTTGSIDSFIYIKQPGDYGVRITDIDGCFIGDTLTFFADSFATTASLGQDKTICGGDTIRLAAGGQVATDFLWQDGSLDDQLIVSNSGDYSLTVTNNNGCKATDTVNINIQGQLADIDFVFNTTCLNDTTVFTNLTTVSAPFSIQSYFWEFGDGNTSIAVNPDHLYANTGSYAIRLTVETDFNCFSSKVNTIDVQELPNVAFDYEIVCAQKPIQFTNRSMPAFGDQIISYSWELASGIIDTTEDPNYTYQLAGIYTVSLTITTQNGCVRKLTKNIEIFPALIANFSASDLCEDDQVRFMDETTSFSVINWQWDMGDNLGFPQQQNPNYLYTTAGLYNVQLTVTNAIGCVDDTTIEIEVFEPPIVNFTTPDICENISYQFSDSIVPNPSDPVAIWQWQFGDGNIRNGPTPENTYDTSGIYTVSLAITTESGCNGQVSKQVFVSSPPEAGFSFDPDFGASPLEVQFTNESIDATTFIWDFGDNSANSSAENPLQTYNADEDYVITLIASNDIGCSDTTTNQITVAEADLNIAITELQVIIEKETDQLWKITPVVTISNFGTRRVSTFDLIASLASSASTLQNWTGDLRSGQSTLVTYATSFYTSSEQFQTILCVEAIKPNGEADQDPSDNRDCHILDGDIQIGNIYPSPAQEQAFMDIILDRRGSLNVVLFDVAGKTHGTLYDGQTEEGLTRININTAQLAAGVYLAEVSFREEKYVLKFVVKH